MVQSRRNSSGYPKHGDDEARTSKKGSSTTHDMRGSSPGTRILRGREPHRHFSHRRRSFSSQRETPRHREQRKILPPEEQTVSSLSPVSLTLLERGENRCSDPHRAASLSERRADLTPASRGRERSRRRCGGLRLALAPSRENPRFTSRPDSVRGKVGPAGKPPYERWFVPLPLSQSASNDAMPLPLPSTRSIMPV